MFLESQAVTIAFLQVCPPNTWGHVVLVLYDALALSSVWLLVVHVCIDESGLASGSL